MSTELRARYDDGRTLNLEPSANHEVAVYVGSQEPMFFDGLDLLRAVSHVVLDVLYDDTEER